jgi:hypothetical protein
MHFAYVTKWWKIGVDAIQLPQAINCKTRECICLQRLQVYKTHQGKHATGYSDSNDSLLHSIQTGSGAYSASYTMGIGLVGPAEACS